MLYLDEEKKQKKHTGLKIAGIGSALVVITAILANTTEIWKNTKEINKPTESTIIAKETQEKDNKTKTEPQIIDEELPVTEAFTEPDSTEPSNLNSYIYINEMDYLSINGNIYDGQVKDNTGTDHRYSLAIDAVGVNTYYIEYFVNEQYTEFKGICGVSYDNRSDETTKFFDVLDDKGNILYTSPTMTASSLPVEFSIDITGVKVLRIQYPATKGSNETATIYDGMFLNK